MKISTLAVVVAALAPLAGPATADHRKHSFQFADALFHDCQSDVPALRGMCLGYLAAIADSVESQQIAGTAPRRVCDPAAVSLEDYRRVLISFLQANPHHMKKPSSEAVATAFAVSWPCKE